MLTDLGIFESPPQHLSLSNCNSSGDEGGGLRVDAAFQQTLWSVASVSSGSGVAQGK